ncbi:sodium-dependent bicarbonate transport family permease [Chrysiogenes arsenatis]|uniref:sodium-dependent bicarbonate transport family permease n=1 Tax=Chrysiogenes arsenatis TaxID=309797 RepID=UPI00040F2390|nr:sodium-dependent bicarbonate transport family permease [Chrysiogenes arsenatis]
MFDNLLDPVVLCFVVGVTAGLLKSDLRFPDQLYESLSIYLLFAIGLKGGIELSRAAPGEVFVPALATIALGVIIPVLAYNVLRRLGRFNQPDAAAIAAHYGSVSAVTYAVVIAYLVRLGQSYESYMTVLLVVLEIPAIAIGILIARLRTSSGSIKWGSLLHEVFLGKSIYLLMAGLLVGLLSGAERSEAIAPLFSGLFKGALALFLLEMGIITSRRLGDLRQAGPFLIVFGMAMPLFSGALGTIAGVLSGLSLGGTTVLATLAGSASYIAAPAAMRIAVPKANPTLYLAASLGVTFPFNIIAGIPIYYAMANFAHSLGGF